MASRIFGTGFMTLLFLARGSDAGLCRIRSSLSSNSPGYPDVKTTSVSSMDTSIHHSTAPTTSSNGPYDRNWTASTEMVASSLNPSSSSTSSNKASISITSTVISIIISTETTTSTETTSTSEAFTSTSITDTTTAGSSTADSTTSDSTTTSSITTDATSTAVVANTETPTSSQDVSSLSTSSTEVLISTTTNAVDASTTTSAAAQTYLRDSGFDAGPPNSGVGWYWNLDPASTIIDKDFYHKGPSSLRMFVLSARRPGILIQDLSPDAVIETGVDYTYSVWIYPTANGNLLSCNYIKLYCTDGMMFNTIGEMTYTVPLSAIGKWQQVSTTCRFTDQIFPGMGNINIEYQMGDNVGGNFWLDTVQFKRA